MASRHNLVEEFARRIGQQLPADYRRFLLAGPVPVWMAEESPANPHTELLHSFFDLGVHEDRDLAASYDARPAELPAWLMVIGEQYGVLIGLGISGMHGGRVYQWSWDDGEARELAPSFDARWTSRRR